VTVSKTCKPKIYYTDNNIKCYILRIGGIIMEEPLYGIEIKKGENIYFGRMYSDGGSVKDFKSHKIDLLFRDMVYDMRLAFGEFSNRDLENTEAGGSDKVGEISH